MFMYIAKDPPPSQEGAIFLEVNIFRPLKGSLHQKAACFEFWPTMVSVLVGRPAGVATEGWMGEVMPPRHWPPKVLRRGVIPEPDAVSVARVVDAFDAWLDQNPVIRTRVLGSAVQRVLDHDACTWRQEPESDDCASQDSELRCSSRCSDPARGDGEQ